MYLCAMQWKEFIKQLLKDFRYSTYKLEKVHNLSSATLSKIITGKTESPSQETIGMLENIFSIKINDTDPNHITYTKVAEHNVNFNDSIDNFSRYPILSNITGDKQMMFAKENIADYVSFPYHKKENCFAVKVVGGDMNPNIGNGDIVLVDMDKEIVKGGVVVVKLKSGKMIIRRYKEFSPDYAMFYADNPEIEPITAHVSEIVAMYKVVGSWRTII